MIEQRIYSIGIIGHTIKRARTDKKLTQKQLAEKTGVSQPTISDIEKGNNDVRFETLFKLTSELNLDIFIGPKRKIDSEW